MDKQPVDNFEFLAVVNEQVMDLALNVGTKAEAIQELTDLLFEDGAISDKDAFIKDVFLRESEGVTGLGQGLAIPHGKSDSVLRTTIAIGRTLRPIEWESLDDEPVDFIILFAVKDTEANTKHIKLLQQVAIKLADDDFIDHIHRASSKAEVLMLFAEKP